LNKYNKNNSLSERPWQLGFQNWGDDVNMLYVACTRAKRQLSIPSSSILRVLKNFDSLHQWCLRRRVNTAVSLDDLELDGVGGVGDEEKVLALYNDLVTPLRTEYSLKPHQLLVDTLIDLDGEPGDGESDGNTYFDADLAIPDEIGIESLIPITRISRESLMLITRRSSESLMPITRISSEILMLTTRISSESLIPITRISSQCLMLITRYSRESLIPRKGERVLVVG
jgi:hypothetical protein